MIWYPLIFEKVQKFKNITDKPVFTSIWLSPISPLSVLIKRIEIKKTILLEKNLTIFLEEA